MTYDELLSYIRQNCIGVWEDVMLAAAYGKNSPYTGYLCDLQDD